MSNRFDSIAVITDQLIKYVHLISAKDTMNATQMTQLFLKHVIVNHRMSEKTTSDRDKLYILKFWKPLTELMGIDH